MTDRCDEVRPLLQAWLDGDCPPEQAAAVEAHTSACAECGRELARYRGLADDLAALARAADRIAGAAPTTIDAAPAEAELVLAPSGAAAERPSVRSAAASEATSPRASAVGRGPWSTRWRLAAAIVLAASAALYWAAARRPAETSARHELADGGGTVLRAEPHAPNVQPPRRPAARPSFSIRLAGAKTAEVLPSQTPNVHVVWIYENAAPPPEPDGRRGAAPKVPQSEST